MSFISELSAELAKKDELLRSAESALRHIEGVTEFAVPTMRVVKDVIKKWNIATVDIHRKHSVDKPF